MSSVFESNPRILAGEVVFKGTRVPLHAAAQIRGGSATCDLARFINQRLNIGPLYPGRCAP